jgi:hypothetical protein
MTQRTEVNPDKEYTITETAQLLDVVPRTVRRYRRRGFLEWRRKGPFPQSGYLIPGHSIIKLMDSLTKELPDTE